MKKKLSLLLILIIIVGIGMYFYTYKAHRNIATEKADFRLTIATLQKDFTENDSLAYKKYQDKTIETQGKITKIELESNGIIVDEKLFATFTAPLPKKISLGQQITIKGRFLGYDDLLEEFKMDQITIIK